MTPEANLTHFTDTYYACPVIEPHWCPECNAPSAVYIERRQALVDDSGASSTLIGRSLYCADHDAFVAPPVGPVTR